MAFWMSSVGPRFHYMHQFARTSVQQHARLQGRLRWFTVSAGLGTAILHCIPGLGLLCFVFECYGPMERGHPTSSSTKLNRRPSHTSSSCPAARFSQGAAKTLGVSIELQLSAHVAWTRARTGACAARRTCPRVLSAAPRCDAFPAIELIRGRCPLGHRNLLGFNVRCTNPMSACDWTWGRRICSVRSGSACLLEPAPYAMLLAPAFLHLPHPPSSYQAASRLVPPGLAMYSPHTMLVAKLRVPRSFGGKARVLCPSIPRHLRLLTRVSSSASHERLRVSAARSSSASSRLIGRTPCFFFSVCLVRPSARTARHRRSPASCFVSAAPPALLVVTCSSGVLGYDMQTQWKRGVNFYPGPITLLVLFCVVETRKDSVRYYIYVYLLLAMSLALAADYAPDDNYFIPSERLNVNAKTQSRGVATIPGAIWRDVWQLDSEVAPSCAQRGPLHRTTNPLQRGEHLERACHDLLLQPSAVSRAPTPRVVP
ncbi:hypothetical protein C8R45DRAFT_1157841 [Mycena sanguinolenta]|nr:hypothetical protein C8R45DRAFT_1157841 [Mycena sanguinolenta]